MRQDHVRTALAGHHECPHAYAVTRAAAETMVTAQTPLQFVADHLLAELITSRRLNAFLTRPMVFWQLSLSDDNAIATSI